MVPRRPQPARPRRAAGVTRRRGHPSRDRDPERWRRPSARLAADSASAGVALPVRRPTSSPATVVRETNSTRQFSSVYRHLRRPGALTNFTAGTLAAGAGAEGPRPPNRKTVAWGLPTEAAPLQYWSFPRRPPVICLSLQSPLPSGSREADVTAQESDETPPLISSWWAGRSAVEALLAAGADIAARDRYGRTPLHEAAESPWPDAVEALLAAGADVAARDVHGRTPLHDVNTAAAAKALLAAGADIGARDRGQRTPLHYAWVPGVPDTLLAAGADVAARDDRRRTPLHEAAAGVDPDAVEGLLAAGADAAARDSDGMTPLHRAAATSPAVLRTLSGTDGAARGRIPLLEGRRMVTTGVFMGCTLLVAGVTPVGSSSADQGHYYQAVCFHENSLPLFWRGPCRSHPNNSNIAWLAAEADATAHNEEVHGGSKQAGPRSGCQPDWLSQASD